MPLPSHSRGARHVKLLLACLVGLVLATSAVLLLPGAATAWVSTGDGTWVWQNPLPQGNRLLDTAFVNASTGWAVGESGTIIHTTDGGDTWVGQDSGTIYDLTSL